jgi:hypothetical protein
LLSRFQNNTPLRGICNSAFNTIWSKGKATFCVGEIGYFGGMVGSSKIKGSIITILMLGLLSCAQNHPKNTNASNENIAINHDSLLKVIFRFAEPYFKIHSVDSLVALNGKPQYKYKTQWGENQDSLLIVEYPLLIFKFLEIPNSNLDLESICCLTKTLHWLELCP